MTAPQMSRSEVAEVLTIASAVDHRIVEEETTIEWHRLVGHIPKRIALAAVELHFQESSAYLMPSHVVANARRVQARLIQEAQAEREKSPVGKYDRLRKGLIKSAPKPANFDALTNAWKDPVEFPRQVAVYNEQLRLAGFPPLYDVIGSPQDYVPDDRLAEDHFRERADLA